MFKKTKILYAVFLLIAVAIIGVIGYRIIEGFSFVDALYMTAITVSTVGFREVHVLSDYGKIFTIFLILTGLGTAAYAISIITSHFIEGKFGYFIKDYKTKSLLKKMKKHVIICGYGRNGKQAVKELIANKNSFIVIDKNQELLFEDFNKDKNFVQGDATDEKILIKAGIKTAKAIITSLPDDADNLFIVLTARFLNPDLIIISRASSDSSYKKLKIAGADNVIIPEKVGGTHMAHLVAKPDIVEFLANLSVQGAASTNLEEIVCSKLPEKFKNNTIYELDIRKKSGANIIGFKTAEGKFIINPSPDTLLIPNSKLFVLGTQEQIKEMKKNLKLN